MTSEQDHTGRVTMKHRQQRLDAIRTLSFQLVNGRQWANSQIEQRVQVGSKRQPKDDSAMKGGIARSAFCGERGLLSPLITHHIHSTMGLILLPRPFGRESSEFPPGMMHRASDLCPYYDKNRLIGTSATCCSLRASEVAFYLIAMGMALTAVRLFEDKTPDEAITFSGKLAVAVVRFRSAMLAAAEEADKPIDPSLNGLMVKMPDINWEFSAEKAIKSVEAAARWHERTGRMLCGVLAWA